MFGFGKCSRLDEVGQDEILVPDSQKKTAMMNGNDPDFKSLVHFVQKHNALIIVLPGTGAYSTDPHPLSAIEHKYPGIFVKFDGLGVGIPPQLQDLDQLKPVLAGKHRDIRIGVENGLSMAFGKGESAQIKKCMNILGALEHFKALPKDIIIYGHSRGAVAGLELLPEIQKKFGDRIVVTALFADPVPGGIPSLLIPKYVVPENVKVFTCIYAGASFGAEWNFVQNDLNFVKADMKKITIADPSKTIVHAFPINVKHTHLPSHAMVKDFFCRIALGVLMDRESLDHLDKARIKVGKLYDSLSKKGSTNAISERLKSNVLNPRKEEEMKDEKSGSLCSQYNLVAHTHDSSLSFEERCEKQDDRMLCKQLDRMRCLIFDMPEMVVAYSEGSCAINRKDVLSELLAIVNGRQSGVRQKIIGLLKNHVKFQMDKDDDFNKLLVGKKILPEKDSIISDKDVEAYIQHLLSNETIAIHPGILIAWASAPENPFGVRLWQSRSLKGGKQALKLFGKSEGNKPMIDLLIKPDGGYEKLALRGKMNADTRDMLYKEGQPPVEELIEEVEGDFIDKAICYL